MLVALITGQNIACIINKWQICATKLAKNANNASSAFLVKWINIIPVMTNYAKQSIKA